MATSTSGSNWVSGAINVSGSANTHTLQSIFTTATTTTSPYVTVPPRTIHFDPDPTYWEGPVPPEGTLNIDSDGHSWVVYQGEWHRLVPAKEMKPPTFTDRESADRWMKDTYPEFG